ncbi:hypothetical protein GCM10009574_071930 [Streptomyces asiaticus]|uniref:Uncharacterized protein n=2 Tax=Streptomyces rhizosphaericus TaxID=114699 RepID=A0ABN1S9A1_9ACTN
MVGGGAPVGAEGAEPHRFGKGRGGGSSPKAPTAPHPATATAPSNGNRTRQRRPRPATATAIATAPATATAPKSPRPYIPRKSRTANRGARRAGIRPDNKISRAARYRCPA